MFFFLLTTQMSLSKHQPLSVPEFDRHNFVYFTLPLTEKDGKKHPIWPPWKRITHENKSQYMKAHHNAAAIRTGIISGIFVIDFDLQKDDHTRETYQHLIDTYGIPNTFIVQTGNGGYHWYFKYPMELEELDRMIPNHTNLLNCSIDVRGEGGVIFAPGTSYISSKGSEKFYDAQTHIDQLSEAPDWIWVVFDTLTTSKQKEQTRMEHVPSNSSQNNAKRLPSQLVNMNATNMECLLNCLDPLRCVGYDSWLKVGFALHSTLPNDHGLALYLRWSSQCPEKFDEQYAIKKWHEFERPSLSKTLTNPRQS